MGQSRFALELILVQIKKRHLLKCGGGGGDGIWKYLKAKIWNERNSLILHAFIKEKWKLLWRSKRNGQTEKRFVSLNGFYYKYRMAWRLRKRLKNLFCFNLCWKISKEKVKELRITVFFFILNSALVFFNNVCQNRSVAGFVFLQDWQFCWNQSLCQKLLGMKCGLPLELLGRIEEGWWW